MKPILPALKRPNLLIFRASQRQKVEQIVQKLGGTAEFPFLSEDVLRPLLDLSIVAIECENSLWKARQMPDFGSALKPQKRLGNLLGLKKNAVTPTVIIKEEDRQRLLDWQAAHRVAIHIWHSFYDEAFGLALDQAQALIASGQTEATKQVFQAPCGATTTKIIYKFLHNFAYPLGSAGEEPTLLAASITDKNGHILPYVTFQGGTLKLCDAALQTLRGLV